MINRQHGIQFLYARLCGHGGQSKVSVANHERLQMLALRAPFSRGCGKPYGSELHVKDWLQAVPAARSSGHSGNELSFHLREDHFERYRGDMVTLIYHNVPIARHSVRDTGLSHQALDHRNVDKTSRPIPPRANLTYLLWFLAKKERELSNPLIEKRLAVDENQRVSASHSDQVDSHYRLA